MASRQVYLSGELVPEEEAKISIFDSAVTLGDTVTESTRTFASSSGTSPPGNKRMLPAGGR